MAAAASEKRPSRAHKRWMPPEWSLADAYAVRAIAAGTASADQQKRAIGYILTQCAGTYEVSYSPISERDSAYAEGQRSVGLHLVMLINLSETVLQQMRKKDG